jgi:hypothetical protein
MKTKHVNLFAIAASLSAKELKILKEKNHDYGADDDPFRNFRRHGLVGVSVRMYDKMARIDSYLEKGSYAVKSEKFIDTIQDLRNYAAILYALYLESKVQRRPRRRKARLPSSGAKRRGL